MKNQKEQYVGVTGITSKEDVCIMTDALEGKLGMYGVLMRPKTLAGNTKSGRWAYIDEIPGLMRRMPNNSLKTIHWCSSFEEKDIFAAVEKTAGCCNAIQLNLMYPPVALFAALKDNYELTTIFQIEDCMFEDPKVMKAKLLPYKDVVDYVIIDQSGGAGIPLDPIVSKAVASELKDLEWGIVLAGGLDATKIKEVSGLIHEFNASVDAEGRLMHSIKEGLDHTKVRDYILSAVSVMK